MTGLIFQPYGVLAREFTAKSQSLEVVMVDWKPKLPDTQRATTFNNWREERLREFADYLWPRFDFEKREYVGGAVQFVEKLTEHEIHIMVNNLFASNYALETVPVSPLSREGIEKHATHYKYEDEDKPGINFRQYDRTLTIEEEEVLQKIMIEAITTDNHIGKKSAGHFWFKNQMQRPRPLTAAMLFKQEKNFLSELSIRGQHPSIVSGHCFQGVMMVCAVLDEWLHSDSVPSQDRQDSLAQYMVDIGDRRVFAGVHYPTDNIASWILAMSLIPEVFAEPKPIMNFLRDAIVKKSAVYRLIAEHFYPAEYDEICGPVKQLLGHYGLNPPNPTVT